MDRSVIAPYRAEEKELSQILYTKLQGLAILYPMSDDLKKLHSEDMFVKPNQQAFFHVMHYLFRLIDQGDFKKRFYWPITDKKSESNFRASTVEYLRFLNEKHQLNWTNIKSYLVVMPGGMKFISFLLELVHFIIKELIRQKEKLLNYDSVQQIGIISEANLQKMCKVDSIFKEMAQGFVVSIDAITKSRQIKMEAMTKHLEDLAETTKLSVDLLTDDSFMSEFEESNSLLYKKQFAERNEKVFNMDKMIYELKENMEKFYSVEAGLQCDKEKFSQQLKHLREALWLENINEDLHEPKDGLTINTLIKIFNGVIGTIRSELAAVDKRSRTGIVHGGLNDIDMDLKDLDIQMTEFLLTIKSKVKKRQDLEPRTPARTSQFTDISNKNIERPNNILENALLLKYIATPPIKLEMAGGHHGPSRLSLHDTKVTSTVTSNFGSFLAPRNVRQPKHNMSGVENSTSDLNTTINRSKLTDPMQLLRSIKKDTSNIEDTPKPNLVSLGSKWKEHQSLFMDKEIKVPIAPALTVTDSNGPLCTRAMSKPASKLENTPSIALFSDKDADISSTSTLAKKSFTTSESSNTLQSPITPFSSNDHTRICRSQLQLLETNLSSNQTTSPSWTCAKKLSAVKKVRDASLYSANLSTSPSGRLEALFTAQDIPKLKLNDVSFIENNVSINKSIDNINVCNTSLQEIEQNLNNSMRSRSANVFIESRIQDEEDAIFNISDSILKDVIM